MNNHLSQDLILRTLDGELTSPERFECESHLSVCETCRLQVESLREWSFQIESAVLSANVPVMTDVRQHLESALAVNAGPLPVLQNPANVMRRFGWGMGIAATLALGVLLAPKHDVSQIAAITQQVPKLGSTALQASAIEVDGEMFLPIPYSNSDLATASPHIVQMQIPLSSLAEVGIVLEPAANRDGAGFDAERSVLADVLMGADGQPHGIHVLGLD